MTWQVVIILSVLIPCVSWVFVKIQKDYFQYLYHKYDRSRFEIARRNVQSIQDKIEEGNDFEQVKKHINFILKDLMF